MSSNLTGREAIRTLTIDICSRIMRVIMASENGKLSFRYDGQSLVVSIDGKDISRIFPASKHDIYEANTTLETVKLYLANESL